ncbi:hypothetical protein SAMN02910339_01212 [Lachnospiraceae bacterium YSD2013]|nr:hypothetical protein SAMN02910339_01212 [Lachnospiraceae bacterium YSD2013]
MKNVILSADGELKVYSVPDKIERELEEICMEFSREGGCFDEEDFVEWLNRYKYPYQKSEFVENIGFINDEKDIPAKYRECKWFNF